MPPRAAVSVDDAVKLIEKYIEYFIGDKLPAYSSDTWVKMSRELNNKWNPHALYTNVTQNRRNILTIARNKHLNLNISPKESKIESDESDDESFLNIESHESDEGKFLIETVSNESFSESSDSQNNNNEIVTVLVVSKYHHYTTRKSSRRKTYGDNMWPSALSDHISYVRYVQDKIEK